jgi:CheY-like chemotaxis protein
MLQHLPLSSFEAAKPEEVSIQRGLLPIRLQGRGRILLIEDDEAVRTSLCRALQSEEYSVRTAAEGQGALQDLEREAAVDLILLDLNLPGMGGWELCERITATAPSLPIVVITGEAGQFEFAAAAGVMAVMEKPLYLPLLVHLIDRLLAEPPQRRMDRILRREPMLLPPVRPEHEVACGGGQEFRR